jgi:Glu-tRNA(Gln) amidotransferase subunit E-like FAD-binding protein
MTSFKIDISKFKTDSKDELLKKLKQEVKEKDDIKNIGQNQAVEMLEQAKENEKDEKTVANIDYLITLIKQYFANQFNAEIARKSVLEKLKSEEIVSKVREKIEQNPDVVKLAKKMLGSNFVDTCIKKFGLTKQAQIDIEKNKNSYIRSI